MKGSSGEKRSRRITRGGRVGRRREGYERGSGCLEYDFDKRHIESVKPIWKFSSYVPYEKQHTRLHGDCAG